ncbi:DUF58 domain-containing protein [Marinobacter confluentis]|uniref:DUF58 domain-containing protein n=1 Tax=Marinobacter confluentis TaxID=1697557 RepID=A0A4Z1CC15_9GAMM|nr:DUF58 domain-containing protein [Marinobacter confluentis]TGN41573.1 DUF58 domain-containing protein [Marinobacter confluentis]
MRSRIRKRWQRWINHRIPRRDHQILSQRNVFILPTGAGVIFGLLLLIMLITGINYQNSLIYLLTFILGAVFVAAMHQTHRNLAGLELTVLSGGEGFPGDPIPFRIRAKAGGNDALALSLSCEDTRIDQQHVLKGEPADLSLALVPFERGYFRPDRIRVETRFPFGLLKAWSWLRPVSAGIVFPDPIPAPESASTVQDGEQTSQARSIDGNDHADIRPWREGDLSQRVLWKRFARTGEMVIADWEGEQGSPQWLDYEAFRGVDQELRLSYLAYQVLDRMKTNRPFGLNLPGQRIDPDEGRAHGTRCLKALAVFGLEKPREGEPLAFGTRTQDASFGPGIRSAREARS